VKQCISLTPRKKSGESHSHPHLREDLRKFLLRNGYYPRGIINNNINDGFKKKTKQTQEPCLYRSKERHFVTVFRFGEQQDL